MRAITKGLEPQSLTEHRAEQHCDYDNYQAKDELRVALVREQRGLCCYCMGRIRGEAIAMKVEHWKCQARFPGEQLTYQNLLGACLGGHGQPAHLQHCDTRKGDLDVRWNPAEPTHQIETRVKYDPDGTIRANDAVFDGHVNDVLNLNLPRLKNNRKGVLTAALEWWRARKPLPPGRIQREIQERTGGDGELHPYSQVAVWWLAKKLVPQ